MNLKSPYGVGKSLEPLIYELFSTAGLDPEKNKYNIFFQEIVRLTPEVSNIIRYHDPKIETQWMIHYAMRMETVKDDISNERIVRMENILQDILSDDTSDNEDEDVITVSSEVSYNSDLYETSDTDESPIDSDNTSFEESPIKYELLESSNSSLNDSSLDEDLNTTKEVTCYCLFCNEFRKYHYPSPDRNVTDIVNETLTYIARNINN
jgi:hypothetical protein